MTVFLLNELVDPAHLCSSDGKVDSHVPVGGILLTGAIDVGSPAVVPVLLRPENDLQKLRIVFVGL